ncbi:hypothetical protein BD769DRAFT_1395645 [Suillus cothurnatus]|nr:hypothetical protein BD769DRAFT_1395645 [Suillus cothurnatus]
MTLFAIRLAVEWHRTLCSAYMPQLRYPQILAAVGSHLSFDLAMEHSRQGKIGRPLGRSVREVSGETFVCKVHGAYTTFGGKGMPLVIHFHALCLVCSRESSETEGCRRAKCRRCFNLPQTRQDRKAVGIVGPRGLGANICVQGP